MRIGDLVGCKLIENKVKNNICKEKVDTVRVRKEPNNKPGKKTFFKSSVMKNREREREEGGSFKERLVEALLKRYVEQS